MVGDFFYLMAALVLGMKAVASLSRFQPRLNASMEGSVVAWAAEEVVTWAPSQDNPEDQLLQDKAEKALGEMLQGLLREDPTALHLVGLLNHLSHWMQSSQAGVRCKAVSLSSALLHFALHLPSFKNDAEPLFGSLVAQQAVSLANPEPEI